MVVGLGDTCLGVRFLPGYLPVCFDSSVAELVNREIPLSLFQGGSLLLEQLCGAQGLTQQIALISDFLAGRWRVHPLLEPMLELVSDRKGNLRSGELEKETGYSSGYIRRIFRDNLGLSPKSFARHIRFQNVIKRLNSDAYDSFADLAADAGYYDQSHLTGEFRAFSSVSPGQYAQAVDLPHYRDRIIYLQDRQETKPCHSVCRRQHP